MVYDKDIGGKTTLTSPIFTMPTAARTAKAKAKAAAAEAAIDQAREEAATQLCSAIERIYHEPAAAAQTPEPETITNPVFALEPFRVISLTLDDDTAETVPVYGEYLHSPTGSILELEPEHAASDAMALIEDETGFRVKSIELEPVA